MPEAFRGPTPPHSERRLRPQPAHSRWRFQFSLRTMLLAALPVSMLAAAWAGMTGLGAPNSRLPQEFFVLMAAAAPMAVMILISVGRSLVRVIARLSRPR